MTFSRLIFWAWRESLKQQSRLFLLIASITIGIAGLVAIDTFSYNLQIDIDAQAKELLGADLAITGLAQPSQKLKRSFDSLNAQQSEVVSFLTMAQFPKSDGIRPVNVRAVRGAYPFFGSLETQPASAATSYKKNGGVLIDQTLSFQFNANVGDSIIIGGVNYLIEGVLMGAPGRTAASAGIAPAVFLDLNTIDSAYLLQRGSRVEYNYYFKLDKNSSPELAETRIKTVAEKEKFRIETVEARKKSTTAAFNNLTRFFELIGFISVLLGCLGIAGSVNVYAQEKIPTVALLRTLGFKGNQAFLLFLIQIIGIGIIGSLVGVTLGVSINRALPWLLKDFLPFDNLHSDISWAAISKGFLLGSIISFLFALPPLLQIRKASPMLVLRQNSEATPAKFDTIIGLSYSAIAIFIFSYIYWQLKNIRDTLYFALGLVVAIGFLWIVAELILRSVKLLKTTTLPFTIRHSIANLYRPYNQTRLLVMSMGLGTMLIILLIQIRTLLLHQFEFSGDATQPNMFVFDIQQSQHDSVIAEMKKINLPIVQNVPIITIRLDEKDGITRQRILDDTLKTTRSELKKGAFDREYRVTYRDALTSSEKLIEGVLPPKGRDANGIVGITLSDFSAKSLDAKVGSLLTFNVQGVQIKTRVTGIREVNFNKAQTNFLVLFPTGVLEQAPQFFAIVTRTPNPEKSAQIQNALVNKFPNVSIIDLTVILKTVESIIDKISYIVKFMSGLCILTGIIVLLSALWLSQKQRIRDSNILRTLGAETSIILKINLYEYLWLGLISVFIGAFLGILGSYIFAHYVFNIGFVVNYLGILEIGVFIVFITLLLGVFNLRRVVTDSPLNVLRAE